MVVELWDVYTVNMDEIKKHRGQVQQRERRFSRGFTEAARAKIPPDLMLEQQLAIWEGHGDARLEREDPDDNTTWRITWETNGPASTPEQIERAWVHLRNAGWGLPAQSIALEGTLSVQSTGANLDRLVGLPADAMIAIARALGVGHEPPALPTTDEQLGLPAGTTTSALDVASTEGDQPAPSSPVTLPAREDEGD